MSIFISNENEYEHISISTWSPIDHNCIGVMIMSKFTKNTQKCIWYDIRIIILLQFVEPFLYWTWASLKNGTRKSLCNVRLEASIMSKSLLS